jgi:outer membrane translocation and assembly module TamA
VTPEQRFFTKYSLWQLADVGAAVFFDAGRAWGDPVMGPSENLGLLKDVGFGLRFGTSRSALGNVIHVDVAFPLDGDRSIDSVQFLVQTKRSF